MDTKSEEIHILLAGAPGDMGTRILKVIDETEGVELAQHKRLVRGYSKVALTGTHLKEEPIDDLFIHNYSKENGILLIKPDEHAEVAAAVKKEYGNNLVGISFTTPEGYLPTGRLFVENETPFILGGTGAKPEEEEELEKLVLGAGIPVVFGKNMGPELVIIGAMLQYAAATFPGALKGRTGYGLDSHQKTKKDKVSGTLVKWKDDIEKLGIDFEVRDGIRNAEYGHGHHYIKIKSPDGMVRLTIETEVDGRDPYAYTTVKQCVPFVYEMAKQGKSGIFSVNDVLMKH